MNLYLAAGAMLGGVFAHFLEVLWALEESGTRISPLGYISAHPYRVASTITSAFLLLLVTNGLGQLTAVTAALIGYACQDASRKLQQRAQARLNIPSGEAQ
jgi:hypothetical protein